MHVISLRDKGSSKGAVGGETKYFSTLLGSAYGGMQIRVAKDKLTVGKTHHSC